MGQFGVPVTMLYNEELCSVVMGTSFTADVSSDYRANLHFLSSQQALQLGLVCVVNKGVHFLLLLNRVK